MKILHAEINRQGLSLDLSLRSQVLNILRIFTITYIVRSHLSGSPWNFAQPIQTSQPFLKTMLHMFSENIPICTIATLFWNVGKRIYGKLTVKEPSQSHNEAHQTRPVHVPILKLNSWSKISLTDIDVQNGVLVTMQEPITGPNIWSFDVVYQ